MVFDKKYSQTFCKINFIAYICKNKTASIRLDDKRSVFRTVVRATWRASGRHNINDLKIFKS